MHHMTPPIFFLCAKFRTNGKNKIENGIFFLAYSPSFRGKKSSNFEKKFHHISSWILDKEGHFFYQLFYIGFSFFFNFLISRIRRIRWIFIFKLTKFAIEINRIGPQKNTVPSCPVFATFLTTFYLTFSFFFPFEWKPNKNTQYRVAITRRKEENMWIFTLWEPPCVFCFFVGKGQETHKLCWGQAMGGWCGRIAFMKIWLVSASFFTWGLSSH